jgi:hypothetical protein
MIEINNYETFNYLLENQKCVAIELFKPNCNQSNRLKEKMNDWSKVFNDVSFCIIDSLNIIDQDLNNFLESIDVRSFPRFILIHNKEIIVEHTGFNNYLENRIFNDLNNLI